MADETCRRILLARRPVGEVTPDDFRIEATALPEPGPGEVLVRTIWLSLDPYMRGRMNEGPSYAAPVALGEVMQGESVGEVLASRDPAFAVGEFVRGHGGWQSHYVLPPSAWFASIPRKRP